MTIPVQYTQSADFTVQPAHTNRFLTAVDHLSIEQALLTLEGIEACTTSPADIQLIRAARQSLQNTLEQSGARDILREARKLAGEAFTREKMASEYV